MHKDHVQQNSKSGNIEEKAKAIFIKDIHRGADKINLETQSLYFIDDRFLSEYIDIIEISSHKSNHSYTFFHLDSSLSGHPDILHGGLIPTMLDDLSCQLAFQNLN